MENDNNSKTITVAFLCAGFLAAVVLEIVESALAANIGMIARWRAIPFVQHGLPVVVGAVTFLLLQFNKRTVTWADEVVSEVRKVVWPSQKDTTAMTIVCCIMLVAAGAWFGLFDYISGTLVKTIVKM